MKLLAEKNYDMRTVPKKTRRCICKNSFLKLGGDLIEITERVHPDNVRLFQGYREVFDIRLVGLDFLIPDISSAWQNQRCAALS